MKNRIRILATSDLHGYIYPYGYADKKELNQGMAKVHTLISSLRDENTIVIDNGDVLEGSPLSFYHYRTNADGISPMTKAMNTIDYDFVNVGNHDFNYGRTALMTHLDNLTAPCITSNVTYKQRPLGPTYVIEQVAGKKVAIFGLVTQFTPKWEERENTKDMHFKGAYNTAVKTVELLKRLERPDYIICVYHGGFERDIETGIPTGDLTRENEGYKILREIPGIDVLIAGHQHKPMCGTAFNTTYVQPSSNGQSVACIDIYTDTKSIEPMLLECDMEASKEVMARCMEEENACQTWLDETLGRTSMDLTVEDPLTARLNKSQLVTFFNRALKDATHADLCASNLFSNVKGFKADITMRDVVTACVHPNTIVVKKINGKVLREYLEKNAEFFTIEHEYITVSPWYNDPKPKLYNYDMIDGIEYTIKVSNDIGTRIVELTYNGNEVTDDMEFTIALNNYRALGGGDFNMLKKLPYVERTGATMVDLLSNYIRKEKNISFEPVHNIHVIR